MYTNLQIIADNMLVFLSIPDGPVLAVVLPEYVFQSVSMVLSDNEHLSTISDI